MLADLIREYARAKRRGGILSGVVEALRIVEYVRGQHAEPPHDVTCDLDEDCTCGSLDVGAAVLP